jgi:radical SAM enzyme (TIGR01210 family)
MVSPADVKNIRFDSGKPDEPRSINLYFDHYRGEPVYRAVVYLANSGCEWSRNTGGCTMCGTKNSALGRPIADDEFFAQFELVRRHVKAFNANLSTPVQTLHIYNDGFFFNDREISPQAREAAFDLTRELGMRKLVIETNGLDIVRDDQTDDYLGKAVKRLGDIEFEVTLGVESGNPLVRALYNKPDAITDVRNSLDLIRRKGATAKGYVLVKGPLMTELEAYEDCVNTIRTLQQWSHGERFRVEFQPVCLLPNTLHEYLMTLDPKDPFYWEPPLLSTLFRILNQFPTMGEDLYSALFARTDGDSPWEFWQTRPHDDPETTFKLYLKLVEHYLYRKPDSIHSALSMANDRLWQERQARTSSFPLEERVVLVKKLLELSRKAKMPISRYLTVHLERRGHFIEDCQNHLRQVAGNPTGS